LYEIKGGDMAITAVDNSYNSIQRASPGKTLGKDDFLKLLVTQLRFQNPLSPLDNTEFTAQLAQFSSLEQLNNINTQLHDLLLFQNSLQNTLTSSLIGKQVKIPGNEVYLKDTSEISYTLQENASKIKISVYNSGGELVKEVNLGQQTSGEKSYVWDGTDNSGNHLPEGHYQIKVEAFDDSGDPVNVSTVVYGTITGITFENNITYLIVDNKTKIQLSDIKEIQGGA
jgi:flagellar basal-body rod modification protein FlgD